MIDINELRPAVEAAGLNAISMQEVLELLDRLEEAESDALEQARLNGMGASREASLMAKLEAVEKEAAHIKEVEFPRKVRAVAVGWETKCARLEQERDALQAKVEVMERQEPVAWLHESRRDSDVVTSAVKHVWQRARPMSLAAYSIPLYLAPGAKGE